MVSRHEDRAYRRIEDDRRMTYQIGLIGRDGWVLASDRKATEFEGEGELALLTTTLTRKIDLISGPSGLAVCGRSGDWLAHPVAVLFYDAWASKFDAANPVVSLKSVTEALFKNLEVRDSGGKRRLILALGENRGLNHVRQFWVLDPVWGGDRNGGDLSVTSVHFDKVYGGDIGNQAKLLIETCYEIGLPVSELVKLAADSVFMASEFNPTSVEGLDIFMATEERIGFLEQRELDELWKTRLTRRGLRKAILESSRFPTG